MPSKTELEVQCGAVQYCQVRGGVVQQEWKWKAAIERVPKRTPLSACSSIISQGSSHYFAPYISQTLRLVFDNHLLAFFSIAHMRLLGSQSLATLSRCASRPTRPAWTQTWRLFSDQTFKAEDLVVLRNKNDPTAPPILTRPLKPGRRIESHKGVILHDDILGRSVRDVVRAQTPRSTKGTVGAEYRLHQVTLEDYCRLSKRLVTPIYRR